MDEIEDTQLDADEIWNLAIEEAAKLVAKHYDPMEPWIEPDEIRALKKSTNKGADCDKRNRGGL